MQGILIFTVVLAGICVTLTTSKPMFPQSCHVVRMGGCPSELKLTGRVCGTDGKTYRNACVLSWKACTLRFKLEVSYYGPCTQEGGGMGGEEEDIGGKYFGEQWGQNNPTENEDDSSSSEEDTDTGVGGGAGGGTGGGVGGGTGTGAGAGGAAGGGAGVPPTVPPTGGAGADGGAAVTDGAAGGAPTGGAGLTIGVATTVSNGAAIPAATTLAPAIPDIPVSEAAGTLPPFAGDGPQAKTCAQKCPAAQKSDIVCGTDNRQYESQCHLTQYSCQTNDTITTAHRGYCNIYNTCVTECPRVYEPVCGTDGITYQFSRCELDRTACLIKDDTLQVAYNGECIESEPLTGCPKCDPIATPVCSSNNITFRSECEFNRYVCINKDYDIEVAGNDSCSNAPLVCPNFCEPINDPVCGSNGVTYPNVCELGLADCHARNIDPLTGIQFVSYGPCDEGTEDPCSRDSPECDLNEAPVCATVDNKMESFYNRCFYEKEVCFDPTITFIGEGKCPPALEILSENQVP